MALVDVPIAPSANLQSVAYDLETGDLVVSFIKGKQGAYRFKQVPQNVVDGFTRAESSGKYFRGNVLQQYPHEII